MIMRILAFILVIFTPSIASARTTPFIAAQIDARFIYKVHVPDDYDVKGTKTYPLVVLVHGTERSPHEYLRGNQEFAEQNDVILLAPLFPLNTHGQQDLENYKLIDYKGTRYDLVLLSMIDEIAAQYRLRDNKFYLHGFSGGGHFAHRFLYLHPHRLHAISIGAPGMITQIDDSSDWWVGTKNLYQRFNARLNLDAIRKVKVQMVIGGDDNDNSEWARDISPNSPYYMGEGVKGASFTAAGRNRIERMQTLKKNFESNGIAVQMDVVPGVGHSAMPLFPTVQKFFIEALKTEN